MARHPLGLFKDACGSALVSDATTPSPYGWNDIDPPVFIDDDGTAWVAWRNPVLYLARLKRNLTELCRCAMSRPAPNCSAPARVWPSPTGRKGPAC